MPPFRFAGSFEPKGDQPRAIAGSCEGMEAGERFVTLLGATGIAVIAFATHATLLARRDIVELLHLSGARDDFIAGLFERRFLMLGVQAGALGALLAFATAAFILFAVRQTDEQAWLLPQKTLRYRIMG